MDLYESHYWRSTILLQKFVGIWQFQEKWKIYLSWVYVYTSIFSMSIPMAIRLRNEWGINMDIVIENIVGELYFSAIILKITMSIIYRKKTTKLLLDIGKDWKEEFEDEGELAVMHKYTEYGRRNVTIYSRYILTSVVVFLMIPLLNPAMDIIKPLENGTRPKELPYYAEYGVDIEAHYIPMMITASVTGIPTIVVLVSFDCGFILAVQHIVGLFTLVNYNFEKVAKVSEEIEEGSISVAVGDSLAYKYMIDAIRRHKAAIEYINVIEDCYYIVWFVILFTNMVMFGAGLFTLMLKLNDPKELFRYFGIMCSILIHFYFVFLPGQKIIDSSERVFEACFSCKWYNLSERTKTIVKIILVRSSRECYITGGKFFIMSMETYCNMMKTGFSIFTLLNS